MHTDATDLAVWNNRPSGKELPWTLDLPMSGDGIRVAFYGMDPFGSRDTFAAAVSRGDISRKAVVATCPPKHVMLWPTKMIHCGGYLGPKGSSAFRLHMHAPLHMEHASTGFEKKTLRNLPRWANRTELTPAYSAFLDEDDGTGFVAWDLLHHARNGRGRGMIEKEVYDALAREPMTVATDGRRRDPSPVRSPVRSPRGGGVGGHQRIK